MDKLIDEIVEIIKNYRLEDVDGFSYIQLDASHVRRWILQFEEDDREFLLSELLHILPDSYLSKEDTLETFTSEFEVFAENFGYESVSAFLDETLFLDTQKEEKSQKVLLRLVDEILQSKYGYSLKSCGTKDIKNWLYIDDVLASGKTFKDDILKEIADYGNADFKESNIRIIASFFILHSWGVKNTTFSIDSSLGYVLGNRLKFYRVSRIDNNPYIHHWHNPAPRFNHVYPLRSAEGEEFLNFIESAFDRTYDMKNENFAFRNNDYPTKEEFYSSPEARKRYENIILKKGIDIIHSIENLRVPSIRPLGMTPPGYKTLGTGSHFFTWRNISNTCPLVFWWGANGWYPLFPVKNRGGR